MTLGTKTETKSKSSKKANTDDQNTIKLTLDVVPNIGYRAKGVYNIVGLGIYSGVYYIKKVTQIVNEGGMTTQLEGYRVGESTDGGDGNSNTDNAETAASDTPTNTSNREQRETVTFVEGKQGETTEGELP